MSEQCDGPIFTEVMFVLIKVPKLTYRNFIVYLTSFVDLIKKKMIY